MDEAGRQDALKRMNVLRKEIAEISREVEILSHKRASAEKLRAYFKEAKPNSTESICGMAADKLCRYFNSHLSEKQAALCRSLTAKVELRKEIEAGAA